MKPIVKRLLIVGGIGISIVVCVVALLVGFYIYVTRPLNDDAKLGDGAVTTVITGHFGPVAIAAYLFQLGDGTEGVVDAGPDNEAVAIHEALARLGKRDSDVRVILLTHAHNDHAAGIHAFPSAEVYAIEPDCDSIRELRQKSGVAAAMTKAVVDGDQLDLHGTHIEVYGVPGHTKGSAAFLVHRVLFLGDAGQGMRNGSFGPNKLLTEDGDNSDRSLKTLAKRLEPRSSEIHEIAFGHSGPLGGIEPLLKWSNAAN